MCCRRIREFPLGAASAYYDHLSAAEIEGQSDWGRVGAASLVRLKDWCRICSSV
jgi:hypothetical protein